MVAKTKGFTLIELLIATSILTIVMFSGYYSYSVFSNQWKSRTDYYWKVTQRSLAFDAISRVIESAYPYVVTSDKGEPALYLSGDQDRLMFISRSPLFSPESALVEFKLINRGESFDLAYNESPMSEHLILNQSDEVEWKYQAILLSGLSDIKFSYIGWGGLDETLKAVSTDSDQQANIDFKTYRQHVMEDMRILPLQIRIAIESDEGKSEMHIALPNGSYAALLAYLREEV
ncbi:prepilin-type N-terminal cleavage/methylation domain-containing protein [Pseudoalteromonas piscicida]|uniref:PulJ/GspJ family protein n=1 Tax=Pseudoalteromonas TaxID=53246 RepID=UPI001BA8FC00|nr:MULTISPECIES: prepilin-type N-terminal cleavage/methylation domain-containing protein [Pseudoalteromonas]QUI69708.1 prepilin-type N-terminal cleavage/methylation domain-containing protein [Pseudoalteromonas sp. M8]UDM62809.1 prepilin-type N-terminal cleavage/methylation domain-containing protein [Pseudoalteromonas piscicida]